MDSRYSIRVTIRRSSLPLLSLSNENIYSLPNSWTVERFFMEMNRYIETMRWGTYVVDSLSSETLYVTLTPHTMGWSTWQDRRALRCSWAQPSIYIIIIIIITVTPYFNKLVQLVTVSLLLLSLAHFAARDCSIIALLSPTARVCIVLNLVFRIINSTACESWM